MAVRWEDAARGAVVGARFAATNRRRWLRWTNHPVVVAADPGRTFAFTAAVPATLHVVLRLLFGVEDLAADLNRNMVLSLDRIAVLAPANRTV